MKRTKIKIKDSAGRPILPDDDVLMWGSGPIFSTMKKELGGGRVINLKKLCFCSRRVQP